MRGDHFRGVEALVGVMTVVIMGCGCGQTPTVVDTHQPADVTEAPLDNERYTILEMATAHGAFTIELEVDAAVDTHTLARQLIEPMQDDYAEILVYFYDRAGDGELPMKRVQWTESAGYVEIEY